MLTHRTTEYRANRECVVALGCFDGVHKGHMAVINTAKDISEKTGLPLDILTFEIPPKSFFSKDGVPLITATGEKLRIFESLGAENTLCLPASSDIFSISPKDFIQKILIDGMKARHLVCGFDYTFGKGGKGNTELLIKECASRGVRVSIVPKYEENGVTVSSTLIREAVVNGRIEKANEYLGRAFSLTARVVDGQHLARKLGFPTVNMIPEKNILLPKNGVYVTRMILEGQEKYGITNVGLRPTVNTDILCAETHIFDYCGDLYGKELKIEFLRYLREETKFSDIEALASRVREDISTAKEILKMS